MKIFVFALVLLVVFAGVLLYLREFRRERPPVVVTSQGPTVERLQKLSQLVTSRVFIADVLIGENDSYRGCWLVRGDAIIGLDLSRAAIIEKDDAAKHATIRLPQPVVILARVNHERSRVWEVRSTSWIPWHADRSAGLLDEVMHQAQLMVTQVAGSKENIEQAKRSAEVIVGALYEHVGWAVSIDWQAPAIAQAPAETSQR